MWGAAATPGAKAAVAALIDCLKRAAMALCAQVAGTENVVLGGFSQLNPCLAIRSLRAIFPHAHMLVPSPTIGLPHVHVLASRSELFPTSAAVVMLGTYCSLPGLIVTALVSATWICPSCAAHILAPV